MINFYSTMNGSGGNVTWGVTLPVDRNSTANQSDLYDAVEFGMVVSAPSAWMDECLLQVQLYPDATWNGTRSDNGNWIGAVVGWQIQAATGLEDLCFYSPLYSGGVAGSGFLNLTQGDRINVTMTGWPGRASGELVTVTDLTSGNQSFAFAFNASGNYPLDPAYTANDVPDALLWSTGGDYPVMFGIDTGRAGNPSVPSNNSYGGCSPGVPPSTPTNPAVPCPSYNPGSWINDTLHPWEILPPVFFNATNRSGPSAQVSFSQSFGGATPISSLADAACSGRVGSAYCSFPWFSYSCFLGAFEFGATDFPGVSQDFGKYDQYSGALVRNAAQFSYYPATSYSIPSCGASGYSLSIDPGSAGGSVLFLGQSYSATTIVTGLSRGWYQLESMPALGKSFANWVASSGVVPSLPNCPWSPIFVDGNSSILARFSPNPILISVTFADVPTGEMGITPVSTTLTSNIVTTVPDGKSLSLAPGIYSLLAYPAEPFIFNGWNWPTRGTIVGSLSLPEAWLVVTGSGLAPVVTATFVTTTQTDRISIGAFDPVNSTYEGGEVSFGAFLTTTTRATTSLIGVGTYNLTASASAGYKFRGWYYSPSALMINFSASTNITLENGTSNGSILNGVVLGLFIPTAVNVTFMALGGTGAAVIAGFGLVQSGGVVVLTPGEYYTVSAAPSGGSRFVTWLTPTSSLIWNQDPTSWTEGLVVNGSGILEVSLGAAGTTSVTFEIYPSGSGQIVFDGDNSYSTQTTNSTVTFGETYLIQAITSTQFTFVNWSTAGAVTVGTTQIPNATLHVSGAGTLIASFVPATFPVTVHSSAPGSSVIDIDHKTVHDGATVRLGQGSHLASITPAGESFESWDATASLTVTASNSNSTLFSVYGPGSLEALLAPFTLSPPTISPSIIDLGISVSFQIAVPAGQFTAPVWNGLPPGCPNVASGKIIVCSPTQAGNFSIDATITDAWGAYATSQTVTLQVNGLPQLNLAVSPQSVDVGIQTNLTTSLIGGSQPYTYQFGGLPMGCSSVNRSSIECIPTQSGTFQLTASAADVFGMAARAALQLVVNPLPSLQFVSSVTRLSLGVSVTLTATVSGGTGPVAFSIAGLPSGCPHQSTASFTCTPNATGTFVVTAIATDSFGKSSRASVTLVVVAPQSSGIPASTLEISIGLLVLLIVGISVFVTLGRRPKPPVRMVSPRVAPLPRPRRPPPSTPLPEWAEEPPPAHEWQEGR